VSVEPSPNDQLHEGLPTPPEVVAVKLSETPTSVWLGLATADAVSLGLTVIDTADDLADELLESVTFTVVVNVPVEV
jgi:hypothetical protein